MDRYVRSEFFPAHVTVLRCIDSVEKDFKLLAVVFCVPPPVRMHVYCSHEIIQVNSKRILLDVALLAEGKKEKK